jgi:hypothetical protein
MLNLDQHCQDSLVEQAECITGVKARAIHEPLRVKNSEPLSLSLYVKLGFCSNPPIYTSHIGSKALVAA